MAAKKIMLYSHCHDLARIQICNSIRLGCVYHLRYK